MQFYYPNQVVETPEGVGRVVHHNWFTHVASVLLKTNERTWVMKNFDETKLQLAEKFLWTTGQAFNSKHVSYVQFYRY